MNRLQKKASLLGMGLLLVCGGVGAGVLASSLTTSSIVWQAPPRSPMTAQPVQANVDQAGAGQAWARSAFDGGLRQCPQINADFLAACQAEMKALMERPQLAYGSYGGPLLITKVEPVTRPSDFEAYVPQDYTDETREFTDGNWQEAGYDPEPPESVLDQLPDRTPDNYPADYPAEPPYED